MLSGLRYTVLLSLTAIVISIFIGLLVALPGLSTNPLLKGFNRVYVELVRAVPILVMILWVYYGMPQLLDVTIFRAGIQSIDKGQYEASHTVALGYASGY